MKPIICGFVPVSLIDYPGKIASVIFTHGCNLRCRYCHNRELVVGSATDNLLEDFLNHLQGKDIEGVVVTGGEPLVSCGIVDLLSSIKDAGYALKLDTNGYMPKRLREVCDVAKPDLVSVDVKAFNDEDMQSITRTSYKLESLYKTVEVLKKQEVPFELRHTLWKLPNRAEVQALMNGLKVNELTVQFPVVNGKWLDKRFRINMEDISYENVLEVFNGIEVSYRNIPPNVPLLK